MASAGQAAAGAAGQCGGAGVESGRNLNGCGNGVMASAIEERNNGNNQWRNGGNGENESVAWHGPRNGVIMAKLAMSKMALMAGGVSAIRQWRRRMAAGINTMASSWRSMQSVGMALAYGWQ